MMSETGKRGLFNSKSIRGCTARKGLLSGTSSSAKSILFGNLSLAGHVYEVLFSNFGQAKVKI